jgi:hypothetical protein
LGGEKLCATYHVSVRDTGRGKPLINGIEGELIFYVSDPI